MTRLYQLCFSRTMKQVIWRVGLLFGLGAMICTFGDLIHVLTHTTMYPSGYVLLPLLGLPFWVPLLFGGAAVTMAVSYSLMASFMVPPVSVRGTWFKAIVANGLAFLLYVSSGIVNLPTGGAKDALIALGAFVIFVFLGSSWVDLLFAIAAAMVGVLVEAILVRNGIFLYLPPAANLFGVASWLPWLYLSCALGVSYLAKTLNLPENLRSLLLAARLQMVKEEKPYEHQRSI